MSVVKTIGVFILIAIGSFAVYGTSCLAYDVLRAMGVF